MARITIDDLEEDQQLDTAAMRALFGGRAGSATLAPSMKYLVSQLEESDLVPGLLRTSDLRLAADA